MTLTDQAKSQLASIISSLSSVLEQCEQRGGLLIQSGIPTLIQSIRDRGQSILSNDSYTDEQAMEYIQNASAQIQILQHRVMLIEEEEEEQQQQKQNKNVA